MTIKTSKATTNNVSPNPSFGLLDKIDALKTPSSLILKAFTVISIVDTINRHLVPYFIDETGYSEVDTIVTDFGVIANEYGKVSFELGAAAEMFAESVNIFLATANPVTVKLWVKKAIAEMKETAELEVSEEVLKNLINEICSVI